jgi:hypothetical protein
VSGGRRDELSLRVSRLGAIIPFAITTMIRKAIGLGILVLILKILMKEVFVAGQGAIVSLFNTANILFSNLGNITSSPNPSALVPH